MAHRNTPTGTGDPHHGRSHHGETARRGRAFPFATSALIAAQLVAWVVVRFYLLPGDAWTRFALRPGTPDEFALLVSPFIHLDAAHLGVNLAVLWLFGSNLERATGSLRFLLLYLGAAWFAAVMQWAVYTSFHLNPDFSPGQSAVGASGAIAGILGASLVRFPQSRLRLPLFRRATFPTTPILVLWLVYTLFRAVFTTLTGITEGVGHWAHFAGFIFGLSVAQVAGLQRVARLEHLARTAEEATARDDYAAASVAWSALLAMRPGDNAVRTALIRSRLSVEDVAGARRLAREGLHTLVRAGQREPAVQSFLLYLEWIPDLDLPAGTRYRIGCWLAECGENELAFRALLDSVREDGAGAAAALYRAGQLALERLRSPWQAREAWECLVRQFPESAWSDAAREGLRRLASTGRA